MRITPILGTKTQPVRQIKQAQQTPTFTGRKEDRLFIKPVYSDEPFSPRVSQIEASQQYKNVVTKWEKDAQGHVFTKLGRVGAVVAGGALGHVIKAHTGHSDSDMPEMVGSTASAVVSEFMTEPVVKFFTKPELEKQKEVARKYSSDTRYGKVYDACSEIKGKVDRNDFLWFRKDEPLGQFLKGLASRYGREQDQVKRLLPSIKGKSKTRETIVPVLEKAKRSPYTEDREMGGGWGQDVITFETYPNNPVGNAMGAIHSGMQAEEKSGIVPRNTFHSESTRKHYDHLNAKLPEVIEYLED